MNRNSPTRPYCHANVNEIWTLCPGAAIDAGGGFEQPRAAAVGPAASPQGLTAEMAVAPGAGRAAIVALPRPGHRYPPRLGVVSLGRQRRLVPETACLLSLCRQVHRSGEHRQPVSRRKSPTGEASGRGVAAAAVASVTQEIRNNKDNGYNRRRFQENSQENQP